MHSGQAWVVGSRRIWIIVQEGSRQSATSIWEPGLELGIVEQQFRRKIGRVTIDGLTEGFHRAFEISQSVFAESQVVRTCKEFGIEEARVILGHRSPAITELYAELDHAKAAEIVWRVG